MVGLWTFLLSNFPEFFCIQRHFSQNNRKLLIVKHKIETCTVHTSVSAPFQFVNTVRIVILCFRMPTTCTIMILLVVFIGISDVKFSQVETVYISLISFIWRIRVRVWWLAKSPFWFSTRLFRTPLQIRFKTSIFFQFMLQQMCAHKHTTDHQRIRVSRVRGRGKIGWSVVILESFNA